MAATCTTEAPEEVAAAATGIKAAGLVAILAAGSA
jgi:hypothetical protein